MSTTTTIVLLLRSTSLIRSVRVTRVVVIVVVVGVRVLVVLFVVIEDGGEVLKDSLLELLWEAREGRLVLARGVGGGTHGFSSDWGGWER
jgi:hypothetical protein